MKKDLLKTNCFDVEEKMIIIGSCLEYMFPKIYNELNEDNILFLQNNLLDYTQQIVIKASGLDKKFLKDGEAISFCIGDDSMYILRPDIEQSLVESNFKDNELCEKLTTLFDTNFASLETISLVD